jgi:uncharacterized protein YcbX
MAHVERLTIYPLKGFNAHDRQQCRIRSGGTLAHDREFALIDSDGTVCNGKEIETLHDVALSYAADGPAIEVTSDERSGSGSERFDLSTDRGRARASAWFSDLFDMDLTLERNSDTGHVDRQSMGPSVISTATLETVAGWFDGMTVDSARRRMRANIEIGGVPAFWEDRFVGSDAPVFRAGDVRIEGVTPCGRCVVPQRDPETGEPLPEFRKQFIERRKATFPDWADRNAFEHFYTLMLIARVPEADRGATVSVGDAVTIE